MHTNSGNRAFHVIMCRHCASGCSGVLYFTRLQPPQEPRTPSIASTVFNSPNGPVGPKRPKSPKFMEVFSPAIRQSDYVSMIKTHLSLLCTACHLDSGAYIYDEATNPPISFLLRCTVHAVPVLLQDGRDEGRVRSSGVRLRGTAQTDYGAETAACEADRRSVHALRHNAEQRVLPVRIRDMEGLRTCVGGLLQVVGCRYLMEPNIHQASSFFFSTLYQRWCRVFSYLFGVSVYLFVYHFNGKQKCNSL